MIRLLTGDVRAMLATLPDASVQTVVTSPPYYGLRDYGVAGQLGLEATPDEYLATMVQVFREVRRVMRDDAVAFVNMGDGFRDKQLLMMPARLALALQADGWWLRSDIIWSKPNPMPESVTDRPTSAHEHVFLLTKRSRYYYDADAVREPVEEPWRSTGRLEQHGSKDVLAGVNQGFGLDGVRPRLYNPAGRNLRNVWEIATAPFPAAHFATFPPELAERCIRAGTSERGCCAQCGKPWGRQQTRTALDGRTVTVPASQRHAVVDGEPLMGDNRIDIGNRGSFNASRGVLQAIDAGWSAGCQCNAEVRPCVVLDCFSGAGTALLVADRLGRDAIGIDLNHQYVEMARARLEADCPLFAEVTDAPAADPEDERVADLFAWAAD